MFALFSNMPLEACVFPVFTQSCWCVCIQPGGTEHQYLLFLFPLESSSNSAWRLQINRQERDRNKGSWPPGSWAVCPGHTDPLVLAPLPTWPPSGQPDGQKLQAKKKTSCSRCKQIPTLRESYAHTPGGLEHLGFLRAAKWSFSASAFSIRLVSSTSYIHFHWKCTDLKWPPTCLLTNFNLLHK